MTLDVMGEGDRPALGRFTKLARHFVNLQSDRHMTVEKNNDWRRSFGGSALESQADTKTDTKSVCLG